MEKKNLTIQNQDNQIIPQPVIDLSNQVILHIPNRYVQNKSNSKDEINIPINQIESTYQNEKKSYAENLIQNLDNIILELNQTTKDKIIRLLDDCSRILEFRSIKYFRDKIINEITDLIICLINMKIKDENSNNLKFEINYVKRDEILLKLIDNRFTILNQEKISNQLIFKLINENQKLIDDLNDLDEQSSTDSDATLVGIWSNDNLFKKNLFNKFDMNKNDNENKLDKMNKLNEIKVKLNENSNDLNQISDNSFRIKELGDNLSSELKDNLSRTSSFNHFIKPNHLKNLPKLKTIINQLNENDLSRTSNLKSDNLDNLSDKIFELKNEINDLKERLSHLNKRNINNLSTTTEIKINNQFDKPTKLTNLKNCISLTELNIKSSIITKFKI